MEGVQLVPPSTKWKKTNLSEICVVCEKGNTGKKIYGTVNGREKLIDASNCSDDVDLKKRLEDREVYYHLDCYKKYCLRSQRIKRTRNSDSSTSINGTKDTGNRQKKHCHRQQCDEVKLCIICGSKKYKGDVKLYRVCEKERAEKFLLATRYFQDEVFSRTSTLDDVNSVFAADVFYHSSCMSSYLLKYSRNAENFETLSTNSTITEGFQKVIDALDFSKNGYELSEITGFMNSKCQLENKISNRQMKILLIRHFGEEVTFAYPKERSKSQLVFSSKISTKKVVQKLFASNSLNDTVEQLANELKQYEFDLDNKFCDEQDIEKSLLSFQHNRPTLWDTFFNQMMGLSSDRVDNHRQRRSDTLFQLLYFIFHNGMKKTPFHVSTAQAIHETCKSKTLITSLNHVGLCCSYETVQRMNHAFAARSVELTADHRVPLPLHLARDMPLRAAMDNFDHQEDTKSGIGGSHDTVLVLFQNEKQSKTNLQSLYLDNFTFNKRQKKLNDILSCQKLVPFIKPKLRGNIDPDFCPAETMDTQIVSTSTIIDLTWSMARFLSNYDITTNSFLDFSLVPSWSAFNSLVTERKLQKTISASVPILPFPATNYASIYTTMVNFQDVITQVNQECGSLFSDEGVYHIAKELQLQFPDKFKNIFLGLGSFHTTKIIINCLGLYLKDSGIFEALVETEVFGPKIVESALQGNHYCRGVRAINIISEAIQRIQYQQFFMKFENKKYQPLFDHLKSLATWCKDKDCINAKQTIEDMAGLLRDFHGDFLNFIKNGEEKSKLFCYWNIFLYTLCPILRDFIRADREGNWDLHLSAFKRALPLFFVFGKVNYARWGSVYYEDCLKLPEKFPSIIESFNRGEFVVQHGDRKFSSVGMDQGLEMCYNKPAKGQGGIIGMTRRKEAIALQDIIKHETYSINMLHRRICGIVENDEYDLHHEFSETITQIDNQCIGKMVNFITKRINIFPAEDQTHVLNLATGKHLSAEEAELKLNCVNDGQLKYEKFREEVFIKKSKKLLDTLSLKRGNQSKEKPKPIDVKLETLNAQRIIDISRDRGYSIDKLLTFELTSTSFFLTKDGALLKSNKSELVKELESQIKSSSHCHPNTSCLIFDFMLHARTIAAATSDSIKNFGDFAESILKRIIYLSKSAKRVDIVFDLYDENSIKTAERLRRMKKDPINMTISSSVTPLPKDMDAFWASIQNKTQFQHFCRNYLIQHRDRLSSSILYLSGMAGEATHKIEADIVTEEPQLCCTLEEADERIFFHINHAVKHSNVESVLIASSDTDVFVCAVYFFHKEFKANGLNELWTYSGVGQTLRFIPVHDVCQAVSNQVIEVLPAVHSLSGCDTTSKFGTKHAALKVAQDYAYLLKNFGKEDLSNTIIENAEEFLTRMLSKDITKINDLRIFKYHRMKNLDFTKLPPTLSSTALHIKRAYLQANQWYGLLEDLGIPYPGDYGYEQMETGWIPQIITEQLPPDFPHICSCKTCARPNICICRKNEVGCSRFCACELPKCHNDWN